MFGTSLVAGAGDNVGEPSDTGGTVPPANGGMVGTSDGTSERMSLGRSLGISEPKKWQ